MKCKKNDCFNCPYPDCINDYVPPIRKQSKEQIKKKSEKMQLMRKEWAQKGLCTSCGKNRHETVIKCATNVREKHEDTKRTKPSKKDCTSQGCYWMEKTCVRSAGKRHLSSHINYAEDVWRATENI